MKKRKYIYLIIAVLINYLVYTVFTNFVLVEDSDNEIKKIEKEAEEKYHIGAAPIGPRELGRNNRYVFTLPARYNYAFPEGYEEVDRILESDSLRPLDDINS